MSEANRSKTVSDANRSQADSDANRSKAESDANGSVGAASWARRGALGVLLAALVLPLVPLLVWTVSAQWRYPALRPQRFTTRGLRLLGEPATQALTGLLTSTLIGVAVTVLACAIGLPAGRAIGAYTFRGRRLVQFLLLAPVIVPGLAVALGIQVLFIHYDLADTARGVVLVQLIPTVPYAATLLGGAFANLDLDYETQARSLGAGTVRVFLFVTLPLLRPALILTALFTFLISWSEYILTLLIGGGQVKTLPLLLFAAIGSSDTTAAAAFGLVLVIPPLLLVLAATRVLGTTAGALAGLGRL